MAEQRKALSKRLRFETFKRDGFKCVYCGSHPPNVVLEADHITPVKEGGKNRIENLVTSCFNCNRGKGANLLTSIPESINENSAERIQQYKEYIKYVKEKDKIDNELIDMVCKVYESFNEGYTPNDKFRVDIGFFIKKIGFEKTKRAMEITMAKDRIWSNGTIKYFCGVCWNMYRDMSIQSIKDLF
jgi:hypothetical protein